MPKLWLLNPCPHPPNSQGSHGEGAAQVLGMFPNGVDHQISFRGGRQSGETDQQHARRKTPLAEDNFAEVLVGCDKNCFLLTAQVKDDLVCNSRVAVADVQNRVAITADAIHDLFIDILIGEEGHLASGSTG